MKKPQCGWLHRETLKLIKERPRSVLLEDIAAKAGVSVSWVKQLTKGTISDPSVNRLEAVYNVLADKPLGE